jgi:hypothetical protein
MKLSTWESSKLTKQSFSQTFSFLSLHSFPAILKLSFFHPQDFVCSLSRIVLRESFCVDGAAEKMGLQNIPPFYSQNGSIVELFIGLNLGSAEATIMNPSRRSHQSLNQQLRQVFPCLEPSGASSQSSCPGTASRSARRMVQGRSSDLQRRRKLECSVWVLE